MMRTLLLYLPFAERSLSYGFLASPYAPFYCLRFCASHISGFWHQLCIDSWRHGSGIPQPGPSPLEVAVLVRWSGLLPLDGGQLVLGGLH